MAALISLRNSEYKFSNAHLTSLARCLRAFNSSASLSLQNFFLASSTDSLASLAFIDNHHPKKSCPTFSITCSRVNKARSFLRQLVVPLAPSFYGTYLRLVGDRRGP